VKPTSKQSVKRRTPQQARAQNKVDLILEAATRLIQRGGMDGLTTNAIAEAAGVSIGTLYQYFDNRDAVLEALSGRELEGLSNRVMQAMTTARAGATGERIRIIVHSILTSYGGRRRVHRVLLEHALSRGPATRLNPLFKSLTDMLTTAGPDGSGGVRRPMRPADAFVLVYAFAGVMRAVVATENKQVPQHELEQSLTRLIAGFVEGS
jgi:AcrR family transcriptional regulator